MTLSTEDSTLFFALWFPLLEYVNKKYKVIRNVKVMNAKNLSLIEIKEIANKVWDEMFPRPNLPVVMEATMIPFKDVIISDGLVMAYKVVIGQNMKETFYEIYMSAKKSNEIINKF